MRAITAILVCLLLFPTLAAAQVRPWLAAHGSYSTYDMSDVNTDIGTVNDALAGSGLSMDEVHGGFGLGAALGLTLPARVSISAGYERLFASREVSDLSGSLKYEFPANAYRASLQYSFAGLGASGAYLGASGGMVQEAGSVRLSVVDLGSAKVDIEGSGPLFEVFTGADWWTMPQFAVTGTLGYRLAKIGEVKGDGQVMYLANGDKYTIDYSGVFVRAGIKFALMK